MRKTIYRICLLILIGLCVNACLFRNEKSASTDNSNSNTVSNPQVQSESSPKDSASTKDEEIRKIDFKNFTYEPGCAGEETRKITVKNGEYTLDKGDDKMYFEVTSVTYGDLNGDKSTEAVILTLCNTGGSGQFSEGFVYGLKDGKAELLTRIEGGDRAYGGLRSAKVENGLLVVESNDVGESGGACCPEFVVTTKLKLEGKNLKKVGNEERRELYPAQRVKFERDTTETTLPLNFKTDDENKRFVIGAQAGQVLIATSTSKDILITLIKGDAEILEDGERLNLRLNESGDFVIQFQKISDKALNASGTIEIR